MWLNKVSIIFATYVCGVPKSISLVCYSWTCVSPTYKYIGGSLRLTSLLLALSVIYTQSPTLYHADNSPICCWSHDALILMIPISNVVIANDFFLLQISQVDLSSLAQDRDGILPAFSSEYELFANDWNILIKLSVTQVLASNQLVKICKQPKSFNQCARRCCRSIYCISKTTFFTWLSESTLFFSQNPSILSVWLFQTFRCRIKVQLSDNSGKYADFLKPNFVFPNYSQIWF